MNPVGVPIPISYWVEANRLLAGEYPGAPEIDDARRKVKHLVDAGVTSFVDLTERDEGLEPYELLLSPDLRYRRMPVRDMRCPTDGGMQATLDLIDEELGRGETVYLHCWGGHGRTGTAVGCWLVRHGLYGEAALRRISELRSAFPREEGPSPQTHAQRQMVLDWHRQGH